MSQVHVGGDVVGQLVVGDHNITVWAEQSVVTVVAPDARPRPARRPSVRLLPRRPEALGRDREVRAVLAGPLVQLHGPAGIGKSTVLRLAAHAAPGEVVFLPAAHRSADDLLQDVFEACYDTSAHRPSPVELRRLLSGMDLRLLLDDLELPDDQLGVLLDGLPDASVSFTSRQRALWGTGEARELAGLPWESALALLTTGLGRPLADHEQLAAARLWRAADGSPLLLLRAVAQASLDPSGVRVLPLAGMSAAARGVASVLALAASPVSPVVLSWLTGADPTGPLGELAALGVVTTSERGHELAPGAQVEPPGPAELEWLASRLAEHARRLPPVLLADHATLITNLVDATTGTGNAALGARLARAVAPVVATSARLGAWDRVLRHGKTAAERAGDRASLAYLTHESGVHALVTGKRLAAAAAIGAAIALWRELGAHSQALLAQQTLTVTGTPVPAPGPVDPSPATTPDPGQAVHAQAAGTSLGVAAKVAIATVAVAVTAVAAYFVVDPLLGPDEQVAIPTTTATTTGGDLAPTDTPTSTSAAAERAVLPTSCSSDPFFGTLVDPDARLPGWESMEVVCAYEKDQWSLLFGVFHETENRGDFTSTQDVDIPGTDEAWVVTPERGVGALVVTVDDLTWKFQFSGTTEDAVAAARRVLGV